MVDFASAYCTLYRVFQKNTIISSHTLLKVWHFFETPYMFKICLVIIFVFVLSLKKKNQIKRCAKTIIKLLYRLNLI